MLRKPATSDAFYLPARTEFRSRNTLARLAACVVAMSSLQRTKQSRTSAQRDRLQPPLRMPAYYYVGGSAADTRGRDNRRRSAAADEDVARRRRDGVRERPHADEQHALCAEALDHSGVMYAAPIAVMRLARHRSPPGAQHPATCVRPSTVPNNATSGVDLGRPSAHQR